jgi:hypothetical protein
MSKLLQNKSEDVTSELSVDKIKKNQGYCVVQFSI